MAATHNGAGYNGNDAKKGKDKIPARRRRRHREAAAIKTEMKGY
jgi:hypothetical protein